MSECACIYKMGDVVVYRNQGVYRISEIKEQKIGGEIKDYYILNSVYDVNITLYVPVDSPLINSSMSYILTKNEINTVIKESIKVEVIWIENSAERFAYFDEIVKRGNLAEILALLRLLMQKRERSKKKNIRGFTRDEKVYSAVQKTITEAFAYSLGICKQEVIPYILQKTQ